MTLPEIPGLTTRAATRLDVAAIVALIGACEIANDGVAEVHPNDVVQSLDLADAEAGVIIVETGDQVVGWATVAEGRSPLTLLLLFPERGRQLPMADDHVLVDNEPLTAEEDQEL